MYLFLALFAALFSAAGFPAPAPSHPSGPKDTSAQNSALVELEISGPRLIHVGDDLKFRTFLVNRSSQVIAFPSPTSQYGRSTYWTVTDGAGRELPGPIFYVCGTVARASVADSDFEFLRPGERMEITNPGDPSNNVFFSGKGFYRVSLSLDFTPPTIRHSADGKLTYYTGISGSTMSPAKQEKLLSTPKLQATSNVWTMYLDR
jgi:hypothetical protein